MAKGFTTFVAHMGMINRLALHDSWMILFDPNQTRYQTLFFSFFSSTCQTSTHLMLTISKEPNIEGNLSVFGKPHCYPT